MPLSSGTYSDASSVLAVVSGYSVAAVTAAQYLVELQLPFACRVGGIQARAATAGTGAGSTVLDVLINGTSIWTVAASRPTLLAASTGSFASLRAPSNSLKRGDVLSLQVASISSTGHARLALTLALER